MKRAKKNTLKRYQTTLAASQRREQTRARRMPIAGPLPGLQAYFREHLPDAFMAESTQPAAR